MAKTIGTVLTLADRFSPVLKKAGGTVGDFQNKLGKANTSIKGFSKKFDSGIGGAVKKTSVSLANGISNVVGMGSKFAGGAMLAGVAGLGILGKQGLQTASDLTEVQNVVDTVFGDKMKEKINTFSKTSMESFGLNELQTKKYSSTLGAMIKSSGVGGESMLKMSEDLTKLSGDMASFYNLQGDEAFEKIRSGISGETEPLKALGVNMSVANLETSKYVKTLGKQWKDMTQAEQTMARYYFIMEATKDAQGDFAKTAGTSFSNQMKIAKGQIEQAGATIMSKFLPALTAGMKGVNDFLKGADFNKIADSVQDVAGAVGSWLMPKFEALTTFYKTNMQPKLENMGALMWDIGKSVAPALSKAFDGLTDALGGVWNACSWLITKGLEWFNENKERISTAIGGIGDAFHGLGQILSGEVNAGIESIIQGLDNILTGGKLQEIQKWISNLSEQSWGIKLGGSGSGGLASDSKGTNVPAHALGTSYTRGGATRINEKGGEIRQLSTGESIIPADKSEQLINGMASGGQTFNFYFSGNVGNEEFFEQAGQYIVTQVSNALGNM